MDQRLESRRSLLGSDAGFLHRISTTESTSDMDYNAQMGDSQYQQHQQDPYYAAPTGTGHSAADYAGYAQPGYPATQPALAQSAYADNMPASEFDLHQGYAQREGFAYPAPAASTRNGNFDFMRAKWPAAFMIVTGVQAILGLCFEA